jgi:hypothetical protein
MITGFNQDVAYKGKIYHVQTEDRGKANPVLETLIYVGGEILSSKKVSYEDLLQDGYDEAKLMARLEQQHRRVVVDIKLGKFAKEPEEAFGAGLVSSRSLDEVILDYLTSETEGEKLSVQILDQTPLLAGEKAWLQVKATTDISKTPLPEASVTVRLASTSGQTQELFTGQTNGQGLCAVAFVVPDLSENAVILTEVLHAKGAFQHKALVAKKGP